MRFRLRSGAAGIRSLSSVPTRFITSAVRSAPHACKTAAHLHPVVGLARLARRAQPASDSEWHPQLCCKLTCKHKRAVKMMPGHS